MPIYEYRCAGCSRKASIFFRTLSVIEADPACPHCGERRLERKMSRVWSRRSSSNDTFGEPVYEEQGVPFYGADPFSDTYGYDEPSLRGDDDGAAGGEDIAAMAREARAMAQMMGEPLDESFDAALRHVEQGADPDEVFGELDAAESTQKPPADGDP
jgi:putative FmdB family regulatory protein